MLKITSWIRRSSVLRDDALSMTKWGNFKLQFCIWMPPDAYDVRLGEKVIFFKRTVLIFRSSGKMFRMQFQKTHGKYLGILSLFYGSGMYYTNYPDFFHNICRQLIWNLNTYIYSSYVFGHFHFSVQTIFSEEWNIGNVYRQFLWRRTTSELRNHRYDRKGAIQRFLDTRLFNQLIR